MTSRYLKGFATRSLPPSHKATAGRRLSLGMTNAFASLPSTMRANHLEDFYQFLRFPSVSTDDHYTEKVTECGHWLVEKLTEIGLSAKLCPTPGHPVVWAHNKQQPGRHTVLIYGHYDVQPPDPVRLWDSTSPAPKWICTLEFTAARSRIRSPPWLACSPLCMTRTGTSPSPVSMRRCCRWKIGSVKCGAKFR